MRRKLTTIGAAAVLGGSAALGLAACGEKRGSVQIEGGTGTSTSTSTTGTSTAGAADTATTRTSKTTTSP